MPRGRKRKKSRKRVAYAHFECVRSRWGPRGTYGRGYRCRGRGGRFVRQSACRRCPASYKGGKAPKKYTRAR